MNTKPSRTAFETLGRTTVNRNRMAWIAGKLQSGAANMSCIKGEKNHVIFSVPAFGGVNRNNIRVCVI